MTTRGRIWLIGGLLVVGLAAGAMRMAGDEPHARFQVLREFSGEIVLDTITQLAWERAPSTDTYTWFDGLEVCPKRRTGGVGGWRLPTTDEQRRLIAPGMALPPVHPFEVVQGAHYWSSTVAEGDHWSYGLGFFVSEHPPGVVTDIAKAQTHLVWYVK